MLSRRCYLPAVARGVPPAHLPRLVAVDLQPMAPVEGVTQLQGDITSLSTVERILECFEGVQADLVVSDGAPDVTGLHDMDEFVQAQLILAALTVVTNVLRPGGTFVAKVFRGKDVALLNAQLRLFFPQVTCAKPKSSRNSSIEAFVVCQGFAPPDGFDPANLRELLEDRARGYAEDLEAGRPLEGPNAVMVPFLACGDLSGYDADMSYALYDDDDPDAAAKYVSLEPVAPPTQPAYRTAKELLSQQARASSKRQ